MLNAKEKAQELYNMFSDFADIEYEWGYIHMKYTPSMIKNACKFACEEAIRSWKPTSMPESPMIKYYEQVIKEIDLL